MLCMTYGVLKNVIRTVTLPGEAQTVPNDADWYSSRIHLLVKVGCRRTDIGGLTLSQMILILYSFEHRSGTPLLCSPFEF
jgi:hypothetical protein